MDFIYAFNLDQHPDNPSIVELSLSSILAEMGMIYACMTAFSTDDEANLTKAIRLKSRRSKVKSHLKRLKKEICLSHAWHFK